MAIISVYGLNFDDIWSNNPGDYEGTNCNFQDDS